MRLLKLLHVVIKAGRRIFNVIIYAMRCYLKGFLFEVVHPGKWNSSDNFEKNTCSEGKSSFVWHLCAGSQDGEKSDTKQNNILDIHTQTVDGGPVSTIRAPKTSEKAARPAARPDARKPAHDIYPHLESFTAKAINEPCDPGSFWFGGLCLFRESIFLRRLLVTLNGKWRALSSWMPI